MYYGKILRNGKLYACNKPIENNAKTEVTLENKSKISSIIQMNNTDYEIINEEMNKDIEHIFKSDALNEIAKINPFIAHADILVDYLDKIENEIPKQLRYSFYKNLETLDIKMVKEIKSDSDDVVVPADYDIKSNTIRISYKELEKFKANQKKKFPDITLYEFISRIIVHELFHMASTCYDAETKTARTGVITKGYQYVLHKSLNEAITEILTTKVINNEKLNDIIKYKIFVYLTKQLITLVGYENVIYTYFANQGVENIKDGLYDIDCDYDNAIRTMMEFAFVNPEDYSSKRQMLHIINFQHQLLLYFEKQFQIHEFYKNYEGINEIIDCLKTYNVRLTTKDEDLKKVINEPTRLSAEKYNELINKYNIYQKSSNQRERKTN